MEVLAEAAKNDFLASLISELIHVYASENFFFSSDSNGTKLVAEFQQHNSKHRQEEHKSSRIMINK